MHGNMLELVLDTWDEEFYWCEDEVVKDPVNPPLYTDLSTWQDEGGETKGILRGGPCNGREFYCRSGDRYSLPKDRAQFSHGFRTAISNIVVLKPGN